VKDLTVFEVLMVNHTECSGYTMIGFKRLLDEIGNEMAE
jgi:hypothetical protein